MNGRRLHEYQNKSRRRRATTGNTGDHKNHMFAIVHVFWLARVCVCAQWWVVALRPDFSNSISWGKRQEMKRRNNCAHNSQTHTHITHCVYCFYLRQFRAKNSASVRIQFQRKQKIARQRGIGAGIPASSRRDEKKSEDATFWPSFF